MTPTVKSSLCGRTVPRSLVSAQTTPHSLSRKSYTAYIVPCSSKKSGAFLSNTPSGSILRTKSPLSSLSRPTSSILPGYALTENSCCAKSSRFANVSDDGPTQIESGDSLIFPDSSSVSILKSPPVIESRCHLRSVAANRAALSASFATTITASALPPFDRQMSASAAIEESPIKTTPIIWKHVRTIFTIPFMFISALSASLRENFTLA